MTIQGCIIRAVALLFIITIVCSYAGAVKIQTELQYPGSAVKPNSSPVSVGTAAFHNSVTSALSAPYKTNSWLSPILWADSKTLFYPDDGAIRNGDKHPIYQLPIYPLPWSLYYCKTTNSEALRFKPLNYVDPDDDTYPIPQGLFIRPMPVYKLYDLQQFNPTGGHIVEERKYDMYALSGGYSAAAINIDPGFHASHIRINRMGEYDTDLVLSASDDPSPPAGISDQSSVHIGLVRGSPFIDLTTSQIPSLNMTIWHGKDFSHQSGTVPVNGKNITYQVITTELKSLSVPAPQTNYNQNSYWTNHTWVIFYPEGSATYSQWDLGQVIHAPDSWLFNKTGAGLSFTNPGGSNYVVFATVPDGSFLDTATLGTLAASAFQYPAGSTVQYGYNPQTAEVTATYSLQTTDPLNLKGSPVQGILPIHYGAFFGKSSVLTSSPTWVENGSGAPMIMKSVLGDVKFLKGSGYTVTYKYPGILPYIPGLPLHDTEGRDTLTKWLKNMEAEYSTPPPYQNWKYTGMANDIGTDSYGGGKRIWSASNTYQTANGTVTTIADDAADSVRRSVGLYFADNPAVITSVTNHGQAPYYSYYDKNAQTVILYPAATNIAWPPNDERYLQWDGYGTATKLNDHHYTWGYFINAAAEVSFTNETWMQQYRDVINQLVFDVAYDPGMESKARFSFPYHRLWDPYTGHCEASGMTYPFTTGNSDESISEELHFWAGVIRWGSASGQSDIEKMGIIHYTQAVYSYYTFWRDCFGNYDTLWNEIAGPSFDPVWVSKNYVPQVWDGKVKQSTFFGTHPAGVTAITVLPMTGASFYHALDKSYISDYVGKYEAYVKKWNLDPLSPQGTVWQNGSSPWSGNLAYYGELACWYAIADPAKAKSTFFPLDPVSGAIPDPTFQTKPELQFTEGGKNAAEVYHFIRFLEDYGTPDPLAVHATNTPYSMTFVRDGGRTYVGYNPTGQVMNITFSDNTVIRNVQPHQFGFYPYGFPGALNASFTASPLSGTPPLTVTCTDTSSGQITGWSWDFGDKTTSDLQNPVHTYTKQGNYPVTLTVTGPNSKTSTCTQTIRVVSSGQLPGNFSISTLHKIGGGEVTTGLSPSLAISSSGISHVSFFSADEPGPWKNGVKGHIGYERIEFSQGRPNITKQAEAVQLTYNEYSGQGVPEWGRTSLVVDQNGTPLISYVDQTQAQPQKLGIAWTEGDTWKVKEGQDVGYGWTPSVAITRDGVPGFGFVSASVNGPRYGFQPPETNYKTQPLGIVNIEDPKDAKSTPDTRNLTLLYTAKDQSYRTIYYNAAKGEIRHAWATNPLTTADWTKEVVQSVVTAGSICAAYDPDTNTLGVAWYDTNAKKLMLVEKVLSNPSWGSPQVIDTPTDPTCSLAYGPQTGVLPGPGISYYDASNHELRFAWREGATWYHSTVDSGGAGSVSSLAYGTNGYPHIAYRHDTDNSLKYAYLTSGSGYEATFDSDVRSGTTPLTVHFWDTTFNDPVDLLTSEDSDPLIEVHYWWDLNESGEWKFEDVENPAFTYQDAGTYDVKMLLNVKISFPGEGTLSDLWLIADMSDYISVTSPQPAGADFTASPVSGTPPLEVAFTDTSGGSPTAWTWNFGDGSGSADQNPVHTYTGVGRYTVTLETNGPAGSSVARKPSFIAVEGSSSRGQAGMIRVHSEPAGADIYLDGILKGQTPVDELVAKTGSHTVLVHLDGYQNWSTGTDVPAGEVRIIPTIKLRRE